MSIDLVLHKIDIDSSNRITVFEFALTDVSGDSSHVYTAVGRLQDDSGTTYDGHSQDSYWAMSQGNMMRENVTFNLIPQQRVSYILNISIGYDYLNETLAFKTETFVF